MPDEDKNDWRFLPPRKVGEIGPEQYIPERMFQYRKWYDNKAVQAKSRFQSMRATAVICAAIVPVLVNSNFPYRNLLTTILSLTVVIVVSLESVFHYGDQWKNYRSTEQFIAQEYFYFIAGDGPYKGLPSGEAFLKLVQRVESAIAAENSSTLNVLTIASKPPQGENVSSGA